MRVTAEGVQQTHDRSPDGSESRGRGWGGGKGQGSGLGMRGTCGAPGAPLFPKCIIRGFE